MSNELHYLELLDISRRIERKEISPVEATQAQLDRIGQLDGRLGSYVTVMAEQAMDDARRAEREIARGMHRGALHGVPIALKDLCWTRGVATAAGMGLRKDHKPSEDATVVSRLRDAGAVILGKLQLTEGAYADYHPSLQAPLNPWNAAHWAGTSSSGSGVATAAGLCYGSLGTDTGGSIRFPSAANGLTGIKPTWGRVSRHGVFEFAATLDHVGPMARSAADAAAMLQFIAGRDEKDQTSSLAPVPDYLAGLQRGVQGFYLGVDSGWNAEGVDEPTRAAVAAALQTLKELGVHVREVRMPDVTQVTADWFPLAGVEAAVAHHATYPRDKDRYGASLASLIELGLAQKGTNHHQIVMRRHDFVGRVTSLFEHIDLLLVPVTAQASPTLAQMGNWGEDESLIGGMLRYTCPFDMSRHPTITLPAGFTATGMPIAVQLVARHFEEDLLVRAGAAFQGATGWHRRHPRL